MKVLITGVAGFIGSNLTEYMVTKGDEVVGIDNFTPYYSRKIKEHNLNSINIPKSKHKFIEVDLSDESLMRRLVFSKYKFDVIINLAGWAGVTQSVKNARQYVYDNVYGAVNLMEFAKDYQIPKFVQAATSSEYGDHTVPWTEDMTMTRLKHPYSASKKSAELLGYHYHLNFGIDFTTTCFFNVYGIRQRPDMAIPKMFRSYITKQPFPQYQNLNTGRDYTYVKDICSGVYLATHKKTGYEFFNLGSSSPTTLGNLIKGVGKTIGGKFKVERKPDRIGEAQLTWADSSKAKKSLGWKPLYTIDSGLKEYWEWFQKQPEWYKIGKF